MPDWLFAVLLVILGVVGGEVARQFMPPLFRRIASGRQRLSRWRKCHLGRRKSRADTISTWKAASPKLLRRTVFRWYEADPQAWWEYVWRIRRQHKSRVVRADAEDLLWDEKRASDLRVGDKTERGHVLGIIHQDERDTEIRSGQRTKTIYTGNPLVKVSRGWCKQGRECPDCHKG